MFLLVAKRYLQATVIIPTKLLDYSKLLFFSQVKTYIVNVNFIESAMTISRFRFLALFLKVFKLPISLQSSDSMSHIFGRLNEALSLPQSLLVVLKI